MCPVLGHVCDPSPGTQICPVPLQALECRAALAGAALPALVLLSTATFLLESRRDTPQLPLEKENKDWGQGKPKNTHFL